jgi:acyl carrier protein
VIPSAATAGPPDRAGELARFREEFQLPGCTPNDRLDALGFDSLGFLELLVYVEGRSGLFLDEASFGTLVTVDDILTRIAQSG